MTSSAQTKPSSCRPKRLAFTLVEMLVVIGIIVVLIGLILPAISLAYKHSVGVRMKADIATVGAALEQYRSDMRTCPELDYKDPNIMMNAYPASVLLCWALVSPGTAAQDGALGPGFTTVPNGQVYGPYIDPSRFKMGPDPDPMGLPGNEPNMMLLDRYGHPILYFKAFPGSNPMTLLADFWNPTSTSPRPMYNLFDDQGTSAAPALCWAGETPEAHSSGSSNALARMRLMLGDNNANGKIDGMEKPVTLNAYLLWSAGPDEVFGPSLSQNNISVQQGITAGVWANQVQTCDDATNYR